MTTPPVTAQAWPNPDDQRANLMPDEHQP